MDGTLQGDQLTQEAFITNIRATADNTPVHVKVEKVDKSTADYLIIPVKNLTSEYPAIGISVERVGMYRQGFFQSIYSGLINTWHMTVDTAHAFAKLIGDTFRGHPDTKSLSGPVGLVSVVGDAQKIRFVYVLMLTALISINLAVLNLIPFPALDGGRVVMVIIEAITRRKIKPAIVQWINGIGFLLLIALMIFVTVKDVIKLF